MCIYIFFKPWTIYNVRFKFYVYPFYVHVFVPVYFDVLVAYVFVSECLRRSNM